jgi:hypothetical protein
MANEKNSGSGVQAPESESSSENAFSTDSTTRARNRTVMLTPEITGQVRKMLAQELGQSDSPTVSSGANRPPLIPALESVGTGSHYTSSGFIGGAGSGLSGSGSSHAPQSGGGHHSSFERSSSERSSSERLGHSEHASGYSNPQAVVFGVGDRSAHPVSGSYRAPVAAAPQTPIIGFLVSYDEDENGEVFELRSGRWIISSEQSAPGNFLVINHASVSPMHAIVRVSSGGEVQVLDQLSEHGTAIRRAHSDQEEVLTGAMSSLGHGDVVRFGQRNFHVCVILK